MSTVLGASLAVGPVEVAESNGMVRLAAELRRLPTELALDIQSVALHGGLVSALGEAAREVNMGVATIAYGARIDVDLTSEVASAIIDMAVDETWAETWPADRVRIIRIDSGGRGSILETTPTGEQALGQSWFSADSPNGLSTFALVALGDLVSGESRSEPPWLLWLGAGLGAVALLGLATGLFLFAAPMKRSRGPSSQGTGG